MRNGTNNAQRRGSRDARADSRQGAIDSLFSPKYSPPSGAKNKRAYDNSWKETKKQEKKEKSRRSFL